MAQSSDRNDFKRNDEDGSTQAEQILDSIIEHIEATDKPVTNEDQTPAEAVKSVDMQASTTLSLEEQQEQQISAPDAISDFKNIEKRAAALASKLGGAGLSYSAGVKKHLEQMLEPDDQGVEQITPVVEAAIHQDDLDIDNERFGIFDQEEPELVGQEPDELHEVDVIQQQNHVIEWNAELQAQDSIETASPSEVVLSEADLNIPDAQIEKVRAPLAVDEDVHEDQPEAIDVMEQTGESVELDPELQNIEKNIEALSSSMNSEAAEPIIHNVIVPETPIVSMLAAPSVPFEEMELRIASLETNIVKLLDDVSLSERKMGDAVREIVRSQTQEAFHESLEMSDVLGGMKAELAQAAEQRHLQDVRMSDSLDALHDALKDIGDRVKTMEAGTAIRPQSAEMKIPTGGGIVSSVLGSSNVDSEYTELSQVIDTKTGMTNKALEQVSSDAGDELPAWLSDATQDLHADHHDTPIESADVFAPNSAKTDVSQDTAIDAAIHAIVADDNHPQETEEPETALSSSESDQVIQPNRNIEQSIVEPDAEVGNINQTGMQHQTEEKLQGSPDGNDFLRSARAAARAANERAREFKISEKSADRKSKSLAKIGNFIEAAKQKDMGVEAEPIVEKVKTAAKNSLFTDTVQGPNSLLVFTSLILFGTSALLLYGMSRNNVDTGSVVKLNAVERSAEQQPIATGNEIGASGKNKSIKAKKAELGSGDERSKLETNIAIGVLAQAHANSGSDSLTVQDKINSSRTVVLAKESDAIRYTGSTNRANGVVQPGSLFDQYISFSAPSPASDPAAAKSTNTGFKIKTPENIDGPTGLLNSASGGDALAQYEVARRFGQGIGVQKSPAISVEWYEKSANAGYAPAIYRLATMYERGKGVAKDYKRAMTLYISAAEKGNVKAMHNLAVLYTGGYLGKADYSNAIGWYRKAAQYGVKDSQFNLAIIYQNGMGGKLDLEQAYKWYSLAARAGDKEAKGMVEDLRRNISSVKRKKIDKKLRIWKPKTPDKNANVVSHYRKASLHVSAGKKT